MKYKESDCVSCERCYGCGRREGYYIWVCDNCKEEFYEELTHTIWGKDLCDKCLNEEDDEDEEP